MKEIKGQSLETVLSLISKPFDGEYKYLDGKYPYIAIQDYESRLIDIVGANGYSVQYPNLDVVSLPNGQVLAKGNAIISLYDDNGDVCYTAEGWGSYETKKTRDNSSYLFLNNLALYAKAPAFKSACESMRMFGKHIALEENSAKASTPKSQPKDGLPKQVFTIMTTGAFRVSRHDNTGKPVYEASVELNGKQSIVIFYPNQYRKCNEQFNRLISVATDGKRHSVNVYLSELSGKEVPTFVFKGFYNKEG